MELTQVDRTKVGNTDMELTGAVQRSGIAGSCDMEITRAGQQSSTRLGSQDMEQTMQNRTRTTHSDMELTKAAQSNAANQNRSRMVSTDMELTQAQRNGTRIGPSNMDLTGIAQQNGTRMIATDMELTRAGEATGIKAGEVLGEPTPDFNVSEVEFTEAVPRGLVPLSPQAVGDITSFVPKGDYESTRRIDFVIPKPIEVQRPAQEEFEVTEAVPKQMVAQDICDITSFVPRGECESTRRVDLFIPKPTPVQEPQDDLDMDDSMMAEFKQCLKVSKEVPIVNTTTTAAEMELTAYQNGSSKIEEQMEIVLEPPQVIDVPLSPPSQSQSRRSEADLLRARFPSPTPDDISPERTEMVGHMPRFNQSAFHGDVTTFAPRDTYESTRCIGDLLPKAVESTRCISDLLPKAVMDVTSFAPKNDYESTRRIQDLMPQPIGDITSFAPKFGEYESTRRINAIIPTAIIENAAIIPTAIIEDPAIIPTAIREDPAIIPTAIREDPASIQTASRKDPVIIPKEVK